MNLQRLLMRGFLQKGRMWVVLFLILCSLFAAFCEGLSFQCLYSSLSQLSLEKAPRGILQNRALFPSLALIYLFVAALLQLCRALSVFFSAFFFAKLSTKVQIDVQKALISKLFSFSFPHISRKHRGSIADLVATPGTLFAQLFTHLHALMSACLFFLVLFGFMLSASPLLTLFTLINFLLIGTIYRMVSKNVGKKSKLYQKEHSALQSAMAEILSGMKTVHSNNLQTSLKASLFAQIEKIETRLFTLNRWTSLITYSFEFIGILHVTLLLLLSCFVASCTIPMMASFLGLSYRFAQKLPIMAQAISFFMTHTGSLSSLSAFLGEKVPKSPSNTPVKNAPQTIEMREVSFAYQEGKEVLRNIHCAFSSQEKVGIVGRSGSGKSSLFALLLRLYEPQKGKIFADGLDCSSFDLASWRQLFGVVDQETFLFHQTIEENLKIGNPFTSREAVEEACYLSGANLLIERLPKKSQTLLGELGQELSGGEKQRLAIARALIKKPKILLLDEATSHLDPTSERLIQTCLETLRKKMMIVVIAHKLSMVQDADIIYVVDEGTIVEKGSHKALIEQEGQYAKLWQAQSRDSKTTSRNFAQNRA